MPREMQTAGSLSTAAARFQRGVDIHFHGPPCGAIPKRIPVHRNTEGEGQDLSVYSDFLEARNIPRIDARTR